MHTHCTHGEAAVQFRVPQLPNHTVCFHSMLKPGKKCYRRAPLRHQNPRSLQKRFTLCCYRSQAAELLPPSNKCTVQLQVELAARLQRESILFSTASPLPCILWDYLTALTRFKTHCA